MVLNLIENRFARLVFTYGDGEDDQLSFDRDDTYGWTREQVEEEIEEKVKSNVPVELQEEATEIISDWFTSFLL